MTSRTLGLFLLFFGLGAGAAIHFHWPALVSDHVYDEDLLQSPHWAAYHTHTFRDGDTIREYARFNESPLQNAVYWTGTLLVDCIPLSKILAITGYGLVSSLFFFIGRALYNPRSGVLAALFFTFFPEQFKYASGFFSKFWAIPLYALALYLLQSRRFGWLVPLLPFAALAYPMTAPLIGGSCAVYLLGLCLADRAAAWRLLRPLALGSALALGLLGLKYVGSPEFLGPRMPQAELLVEMGKVGKYVPIPSLPRELLSDLGWPGRPAAFQLGSALLFLLVLRRRVAWQPSWIAMLVASAVFYVLASELFGLLYIPNRYTRNSVAVLLVLWNAANWDRLLARIPRPAWRHAALAAMLAVAGYCFDSLERGKWVWDDTRFAELGAFVRTLPAGVLVAAPSRFGDRVMLQGRRSTLVPFLLDHCWFSRPHEQNRQHTLDVFRAIYAEDVGPINGLHERYGATHLLLSWPHFGERRIDRNFASRYEDEVDTIVGGRTRFLLAAPPPSWVVFDDGVHFAVELPLPPPFSPELLP